MAFTLLQVGADLKTVNGTGGLSAALTLPSGIALSTNRIPRFARFNRKVIVVNTPTRPIQVDEDGKVYPLTPLAPQNAVALAAGSAGSLSGDYLAVQTYIIKDANGNIITESDYSPLMSAAVSVSSKELDATYDASIETGVVIGTRLYRTTDGGSTYFPWIDDMTNGTTISSDLADAELSSVEADDRGSAPDLTLIAEWAGRLWGVDRDDVDDLRFTQAGTAYAWSALNTIKIPHYGEDAAGITALIPRRNALGVSRRGVFTQVTGSQRTNFQPVVVNGGERMGCVSQESVVIFNDVAFFLGNDGVYKWDNAGISCISNGRVRSWFATDTYFNRAMFWRAFAQFDPVNLKYRLFLAAAGGTTINRWVEYDLLTGAWWGVHKTAAFTPSCCVEVAGDNLQPWAMVGSSDGYLSKWDESTKNDWTSSAIDMSVLTDEHIPDPERQSYFGEADVYMEKQAAGDLTVTPYLGNIDDTTAQTAFTAAMTATRRRLGRIGVGSSMQLKFDQATIDQDAVIYGYAVDPVHPVGRR